MIKLENIVYYISMQLTHYNTRNTRWHPGSTEPVYDAGQKSIFLDFKKFQIK
jgi:hypothetical protein